MIVNNPCWALTGSQASSKGLTCINLFTLHKTPMRKQQCSPKFILEISGPKWLHNLPKITKLRSGFRRSCSIAYIHHRHLTSAAQRTREATRWHLTRGVREGFMEEMAFELSPKGEGNECSRLGEKIQRCKTKQKMCWGQASSMAGAGGQHGGGA